MSFTFCTYTLLILIGQASVLVQVRPAASGCVWLRPRRRFTRVYRVFVWKQVEDELVENKPCRSFLLLLLL